MAGRCELTTLCYIERDGCYLMLHRVRKKKDVNRDKWIGVGGHALPGESPEDCLLREVREETGYTLTSYRFRGLVTFITETGFTEYMCLYTADGLEGEETDCDEGVLEWVPKERVLRLNIWEGDKIFFRLLNENQPFFSLKLRYHGDVLAEAALDGQPMELLDERDERGEKTGVVMERSVAHRDGRAHGTAHVWIVRARTGGGWDVLLQKRSETKDAYPGCYDISSAGHVSAGDDFLPTALRELEEELGIRVSAKELEFAGMDDDEVCEEFHGKPFRDHEISRVYVLRKSVEEKDLTLQESEVESVMWLELSACMRAVREGSIPNCMHLEELELLRKYLEKAPGKDRGNPEEKEQESRCICSGNTRTDVVK